MIKNGIWAFILFLAGGLFTTYTVQAENSVWWEGEHSVETNFPKETWFSESTFSDKRDLLSDGAWLTNADTRTGDEAYAKYNIEVPADGKYRFWVRKFWKHGPFRWRFDDDDWRICTRDVQLEDSVEIRKFLGVNWVYLGWVELAKGAHDFELRLLARKGENLTACFDAFYLTSNDNIVPSGAHRPQPRQSQPGPGDWFPVTFYEDEFSTDSVIDMSHLVEAPAGKYGFLKQVDNELQFEKSDKPVKFWGCGANYLAMSKPEMTQRIRYLRKHGINMVRQHPLQSVLGLLRKNGTFNPEKLDEWDWWFAELKKHGIYMTWSLFYPHRITPDESYDLYDELPDGKGAKSTSGLVNIEPVLQGSEWRWTKAILLHKNKYTGLRYVDDPAMAVVEVHNEDCIFWHWPLNDLASGKMPKHAARLKKRWAEWLKQRYGSDDKLREAWGAGMRQGDSVNNPNMSIYGAWEMKADGPELNKSEKKRMGDFIRFLSELQRGYYQKRMERLREIGYQAVTITTAWRAGGAAADPANLWCDTAAGMISRHNYFGGGVGGHDVKVGKVNNGSHLPQPGGGILASGMYQVEDRAFCMTEWTSKPPNQWKLEIAPLVAFYGLGLQGWDASYHFLNARNRLGNGWPGQRSYVTDTPHYIGQFPALAFAIYNNHIKPAPIAAARRVKVDDLFQGIDVLSQDFTGGGYDAKELKGNLATSKELLAVGRITVTFDGGNSELIDVDKYWDKSRKVIHSITGELTWDYSRQLVTLSAPKTQAIIGRTGGETTELPGVTATVTTPFVSLIFTPLDNMELARSKHILITAMAQDKQTDTEYNEDGTQLLKIGSLPLLMEPVQATIRFKGSVPREVNVLDVYGVPTDRKVNLQTDGSFHIDGTYATYYYEVLR